MSTITSLIGRLRPKNSFARGVGMLATGSAVSQIIAISILPLLTRLYSPEQFGVLAEFAGILGIASVIASLRFELAIPLPVRDGAALHVVALSIVLVSLTAVIAATMTFTATSILNSSLNGFSGNLFALCVGIGVLVVGLYQVGNYWAVRKRAYGVITKTRIQQGIGGAATQTLFGLLHFGPAGLIIGQITGQAAGLARLFLNIRQNYKAKKLRISYRGIQWALKRYRRFPIYDSWAAILNVASAQAPTILFAALFSPLFAGYYALGFSILSAPITLIGKSISQVLLPSIIDARRNGDLPKLIRSTQHMLARIVFVPFGVFIAVAPLIFGSVFGQRWHDAGSIAVWTAIWISWQFIYSPLSVVILGLEAQAANLVIQTIFFVVRIGSVVVGYIYGSAQTALILYTAASMLCYFAGLIVIARLSGLTTRSVLLDLGVETLYGIVAFVVLSVNDDASTLTATIAAICITTIYLYRLKTFPFALPSHRIN